MISLHQKQGNYVSFKYKHYFIDKLINRFSYKVLDNLIIKIMKLAHTMVSNIYGEYLRGPLNTEKHNLAANKS